MATLNKGRPLTTTPWNAKSEVIEIICAGLPGVKADLGPEEADVKTNCASDAFPRPAFS
jgi:hypothetical protein